MARKIEHLIIFASKLTEIPSNELLAPSYHLLHQRTYQRCSTATEPYHSRMFWRWSEHLKIARNLLWNSFPSMSPTRHRHSASILRGKSALTSTTMRLTVFHWVTCCRCCRMRLRNNTKTNSRTARLNTEPISCDYNALISQARPPSASFRLSSVTLDVGSLSSWIRAKSSAKH